MIEKAKFKAFENQTKRTEDQGKQQINDIMNHKESQLGLINLIFTGENLLESPLHPPGKKR